MPKHMPLRSAEELEPRLAPSISAPVLMRDINTIPENVGSTPRNFVDVNGTVFFTTNSVDLGTEIWKTDGTENGTQLVRGGFPGYADPAPSQLTNYDGRLFFTATEGDITELWHSDGASTGTARFFQNNHPLSGTYVFGLTTHNGMLFFSSSSESSSAETLWKSDGTNQGTVPVYQFAKGIESNRHQLASIGTELFFWANDGINGAELWKTDGSSGGTKLVADVRPGSAGAFSTNIYKAFSTIGHRLYFSAIDRHLFNFM